MYDTVYHFAAGYYIVKTNYCEYSTRRTYLRFKEPYSNELKYRYIEIPSSAFIHLHDYNNEIREKKTAILQKAVAPSIIEVPCEKWMLRKEDCR